MKSDLGGQTFPSLKHHSMKLGDLETSIEGFSVSAFVMEMIFSALVLQHSDLSTA